MTQPTCEEVADQLVDYADGDLPAAESAQIAAHTAHCDRCHRQLAALQESLSLARTIWQGGEADLAATQPRHTSRFTHLRVTSRSLRWAAGIAAAVALLVTIGIYQRSARQDAQPVVHQPQSLTPRELELQIARAGIAMQLLTAADILAEQPGGQELACDRYRYVLGTYPDTEAGLESASRLESLCEERKGT